MSLGFGVMATMMLVWPLVRPWALLACYLHRWKCCLLASSAILFHRGHLTWRSVAQQCGMCLILDFYAKKSHEDYIKFTFCVQFSKVWAFLLGGFSAVFLTAPDIYFFYLSIIVWWKSFEVTKATVESRFILAAFSICLAHCSLQILQQWPRN